MLVKLGENDVKTVEDLAGCATDDLVGWTERKDGETLKHAGFLDGFDLSREEAEAMIMAARVKAGWIDAAGCPSRSTRRGRAAACCGVSSEERLDDAFAGDGETACRRSDPPQHRARRTRRPGADLHRHARERAPEEMIRFVLGAGRRVVPDLRRKLPGRGVWVTARADDRRSGGSAASVFARAFKANGQGAPTPGRRRRRACSSATALQSLSLANKAGCRRRLRQGRGGDRQRRRRGARFTPATRAPDGVRKLGQALRRRCGGEASSPRINLFGPANWIWHWAGQM